jgi:hypothetical protein
LGERPESREAGKRLLDHFERRAAGPAPQDAHNSPASKAPQNSRKVIAHSAQMADF